MLKKISIIIPFYNPGVLIKNNFRNLNEIQIENPDLQIIYVDNNSSDKSYSYVKNKIKQNKNIKIYKTNSNQGPGIARNLGVKKTKTKYIIFLDVDDCLEIINLKKLYKVLEQKKPNVVYLKKIKEINSPSIKFGKKNLNIFFKKKINLETIATIFNVNFLNTNKISFKSGIFEDILFNFKYHFFNKKKILYSSDVIYNKISNPKSITGSNIDRVKILNRYKAWLGVKLFIRKKIKKKEYKSLMTFFQFRVRGELVNDYVRIQKSRFPRKKERYLISYLLHLYKKIIRSQLNSRRTFKDKIAYKILNEKKI
jgi:glycosyltransferase involved in cell wall biosynthesis